MHEGGVVLIRHSHDHPRVVEVAPGLRCWSDGDQGDRVPSLGRSKTLMPIASKPFLLFPVRLGICATLSRTRCVSDGCLCFEIFAGSPSEIRSLFITGEMNSVALLTCT